MNPETKTKGQILDESTAVAQRAANLIGGSFTQGVGFTNEPITSDVLSANETPLNIPETTPSTSAAGLSAFASSVGEQEKERAKLQAEQEAKVAEAQAGAKEEKGKLRTLMDKILSVPAEQARLEEEAGIGEKAERVTNYTNQLEALERAELNEIRALDNMQGTLEQKAQITRDIQRQYAFQKADVALLQASANRDLETTQNIINRKIELTLQPLQQQLEFTKFFYENNKADLTKAEDKMFGLKIQELDRQYEETKDLETYKAGLLTTAIQNGVNIPSYVLSELNRASSTEEAAQVLASNNISFQDPMVKETQRLQQEKLREEIAKIKSEGESPAIFDISTESGQLASMAQNMASKFSTKFSQQSFLANVQRISQQGTPQELADYVFSEAISQIPDSEARKKSIARYGLVFKLNTLEEQLAAFEALGGDTGFFKGNIEDIRNKFGQVKDPQLAQLGISLLDTLDAVARDRTGAVISESEEKFYDRLIPSTRKTSELNQAVVNGLRNSLVTDINSTLRFQLTGTGFDTIENYLGFQANNNLITAAQEGRLQVDPETGDLILITN